MVGTMDFRERVRALGPDVWAVIDTALDIVREEFPAQLRARRDRIAEKLFAPVGWLKAIKGEVTERAALPSRDVIKANGHSDRMTETRGQAAEAPLVQVSAAAANGVAAPDEDDVDVVDDEEDGLAAVKLRQTGDPVSSEEVKTKLNGDRTSKEMSRSPPAARTPPLEAEEASCAMRSASSGSRQSASPVGKGVVGIAEAGWLGDIPEKAETEDKPKVDDATPVANRTTTAAAAKPVASKGAQEDSEDEDESDDSSDDDDDDDSSDDDEEDDGKQTKKSTDVGVEKKVGAKVDGESKNEESKNKKVEKPAEETESHEAGHCSEEDVLKLADIVSNHDKPEADHLAALEKLNSFNISVGLLTNTMIGRIVKKLARRTSCPKVQAFGTEIVNKWMKLVTENPEPQKDESQKEDTQKSESPASPPPKLPAINTVRREDSLPRRSPRARSAPQNGAQSFISPSKLGQKDADPSKKRKIEDAATDEERLARVKAKLAAGYNKHQQAKESRKISRLDSNDALKLLKPKGKR